MNNLKEILEAVLFVSGDGVSKDDLLDKLQVLEEDLDKAIADLKAKYDEKSGIHIITYRNKVQLCSNSDYADDVANVLNPIRERKLSKATLEAMAIIAYKQPITRLEVENIRGVNSDYALQMLIKHNLIEVIGRKDTIGKPMLFGTTDEFLKRFDLKDLNELPDYEELLESISVINARADHNLYDEFEIEEEDENQEDKERLFEEEVAKAIAEQEKFEEELEEKVEEVFEEIIETKVEEHKNNIFKTKEEEEAFEEELALLRREEELLKHINDDFE
ncbi:MAG: SMC-Scp complex subunit ScpB [Spirochaetales bacterium]